MLYHGAMTMNEEKIFAPCADIQKGPSTTNVTIHGFKITKPWHLKAYQTI